MNVSPITVQYKSKQAGQMCRHAHAVHKLPDTCWPTKLILIKKTLSQADSLVRRCRPEPGSAGWLSNTAGPVMTLRFGKWFSLININLQIASFAPEELLFLLLHLRDLFPAEGQWSAHLNKHGLWTLLSVQWIKVINSSGVYRHRSSETLCGRIERKSFIHIEVFRHRPSDRRVQLKIYKINW